MNTKSFDTQTNYDTITVRRHVIYTKVYDYGMMDNCYDQQIELTFAVLDKSPIDVTGKVIIFTRDRRPSITTIQPFVANAILLSVWDKVTL